MIDLALKVAKGEKELNNDTITEMIESNMERAHKLLKSGYDKTKAWDLFYNILNKNKKLTSLVMDEAMARLKGNKAWSMKDYVKA